jgi:hypothetical protein
MRGGFRRHRGVRLVVALLLAVTASAGLSGWSFGRGLTQSANADSRPLVGFSFSPISAYFEGDDPRLALAALLEKLSPDVVRLPVYWERVEPAPGDFNYQELDGLLAEVASHNFGAGSRPTRVVLVVGARNIGQPEVHIPAWLPARERDPVALAVADPAYAAYFRRTVLRYAGNRLLAAWQVENEALDNVSTPVGRAVSVPADELEEDIDVVHRLDPGRPAILSTYNNSTLSLDLDQMSAPNARKADRSGATPVGHPQPSMEMADILGLDAYVATGETSLADGSVSRRVAWKVTGLRYWADEARFATKSMWITEMQGESWPGKTTFTPQDLLTSAREYRKVGAGAVLLWGVEGWLHQPPWMTAGIQARAILGS